MTRYRRLIGRGKLHAGTWAGRQRAPRALRSGLPAAGGPGGMGNRMKRGTKALLIVAALAAIVAVGAPAMLRARAESQRNVCINNLLQLTGPMMCCVPMAYRLSEGDPLDPRRVCEYIKGNTMPVCPAGGTYSVTWIVGGPTPKCSVHGDVLWDLYHVRTLKELDELNHRAERTPQTSRGDSVTRTNAGPGAPLE